MRNLMAAVMILLASLPGAGRQIVEVPVEKVRVVGINMVEMKLLSISVEITPSASDTLIMEAPDLPSGAELRCQRIAGRLEVWVEGSVGSATVKCALPAQTRLSVSTVSGAADIKDLQSGVIQIHTVSGKINLSGCRGPTELESASGSIELNQCTGTVTARSMSGSISVAKHDGEITAVTASGSQDYEEIRGDLRATTGSGSIDIERITGMLRLETASGSISGESVSLTGESEFKSVSGSISVEILNRSDDLRFELSTTSGTLQAKGSAGSGSLTRGKGRIVVKGTTVSGSQTYD